MVGGGVFGLESVLNLSHYLFFVALLGRGNLLAHLPTCRERRAEHLLGSQQEVVVFEVELFDLGLACPAGPPAAELGKGRLGPHVRGVGEQRLLLNHGWLFPFH